MPLYREVASSDVADHTLSFGDEPFARPLVVGFDANLSFFFFSMASFCLAPGPCG